MPAGGSDGSAEPAAPEEEEAPEGPDDDEEEDDDAEPDGEVDGICEVLGDGAEGVLGADGAPGVDDVDPGDGAEGAGDGVGEGRPALPLEPPELVSGLGIEGAPPEEFVLQPATISVTATSDANAILVFIARRLVSQRPAWSRVFLLHPR